jgi:hypothetical protein
MAPQRNKIISKLRHKHRLVLMNDETFAEIASVKINLLNTLSILSALMLLIGVSSYFIYGHTSLRNILPNGLSGADKQELINLNQEINDLKKQLEIRNQKAQVLTDLLSDKEHKYDSTSVRLQP